MASKFAFIPTYEDLDAAGEIRATPKHEMTHRVVAKEEKKKTKAEQSKFFRDEVWRLDGNKCRATRVQLSRAGIDDHKVGEVDHAIPRSLAPERLYDVSNGILISRYLNRLRKVACAEAPEFQMFSYTGPDNRRELQTFRWRDRTGKVIRTEIG